MCLDGSSRGKGCYSQGPGGQTSGEEVGTVGIKGMEAVEKVGR